MKGEDAFINVHVGIQDVTAANRMEANSPKQLEETTVNNNNNNKNPLSAIENEISVETESRNVTVLFFVFHVQSLVTSTGEKGNGASIQVTIHFGRLECYTHHFLFYINV